jgi:uridine kinase
MEKRPVLIGIAGGSGSGKTYLARKVRETNGQIVSMLSMDQYFRTEASAKTSQVNFDHPAHLDLDLLVEHLTILKSGHVVRAPTYDFRTTVQMPAALEIEPRPVIVVEGLFVLASPVLECFDLTCFLDVDDDQRLLGRILRDLDERDASIADIVDRYQRFVRPSYHVFVAPTKQNADVVVDFTYRRNFFTQLLIELVRDIVREDFDLESFVSETRNESYRLGYKAQEAFMPMAIDIRALAKAYPESAYPPSAPPLPLDKPKLFLEDGKDASAG